MRVGDMNLMNVERYLERDDRCVLPLGSTEQHAQLSLFPWTRLPNRGSPAEPKPITDPDRLRLQNPAGVRTLLGDGNYGGRYRRSDEEMQAIWDVAVAETRALIEGPWQ